MPDFPAFAGFPGPAGPQSTPIRNALSVSYLPPTISHPPLEAVHRLSVAKHSPYSRVRGSAAGLLECGLEVRLRGPPIHLHYVPKPQADLGAAPIAEFT